MNSPATTLPRTYRDGIVYQAALLGGFALLAAGLLVLGNLLTRDAIRERAAEDLRASLTQVIPAALHDNDLLANPMVLTEQDQTGRNQIGHSTPLTVYRALQGLDVTAVAFMVTGAGYAGPIDLMLGIDTQGRVLGVRVLTHQETPGLGDRIEVARDDWIRGFDGRALGDPPRERWAVRKDGGDFDQFSGATITPRAVVQAVRDGLQTFARYRDSLTASAVIEQGD